MGNVFNLADYRKDEKLSIARPSGYNKSLMSLSDSLDRLNRLLKRINELEKK